MHLTKLSAKLRSMNSSLWCHRGASLPNVKKARKLKTALKNVIRFSRLFNTRKTSSTTNHPLEDIIFDDTTIPVVPTTDHPPFLALDLFEGSAEFSDIELPFVNTNMQIPIDAFDEYNTTELEMATTCKMEDSGFFGSWTTLSIEPWTFSSMRAKHQVISLPSNEGKSSIEISAGESEYNTDLENKNDVNIHLPTCLTSNSEVESRTSEVSSVEKLPFSTTFTSAAFSSLPYYSNEANERANTRISKTSLSTPLGWLLSNPYKFRSKQIGEQVFAGMPQEAVVSASPEDSDAEDSDAEDSDAEDSDAEDSNAEDSDAEDSDAEDSDAEDSNAEDSDAEDSDAEDSDAEDSDAEDSGIEFHALDTTATSADPFLSSVNLTKKETGTYKSRVGSVSIDDLSLPDIGMSSAVEDSSMFKAQFSVVSTFSSLNPTSFGIQEEKQSTKKMLNSSNKLPQKSKGFRFRKPPKRTNNPPLHYSSGSYKSVSFGEMAESPSPRTIGALDNLRDPMSGNSVLPIITVTNCRSSGKQANKNSVRRTRGYESDIEFESDLDEPCAKPATNRVIGQVKGKSVRRTRGCESDIEFESDLDEPCAKPATNRVTSQVKMKSVRRTRGCESDIEFESDLDEPCANDIIDERKAVSDSLVRLQASTKIMSDMILTLDEYLKWETICENQKVQRSRPMVSRDPVTRLLYLMHQQIKESHQYRSLGEVEVIRNLMTILPSEFHELDREIFYLLETSAEQLEEYWKEGKVPKDQIDYSRELYDHACCTLEWFYGVQLMLQKLGHLRPMPYATRSHPYGPKFAAQQDYAASLAYYAGRTTMKPTPHQTLRFEEKYCMKKGRVGLIVGLGY